MAEFPRACCLAHRVAPPSRLPLRPVALRLCADGGRACGLQGFAQVSVLDRQRVYPPSPCVTRGPARVRHALSYMYPASRSISPCARLTDSGPASARRRISTGRSASGTGSPTILPRYDGRGPADLPALRPVDKRHRPAAVRALMLRAARHENGPSARSARRASPHEAPRVAGGRRCRCRRASCAAGPGSPRCFEASALASTARTRPAAPATRRRGGDFEQPRHRRPRRWRPSSRHGRCAGGRTTPPTGP